MSAGSSKEPMNEQVIANMYSSMHSEVNQIHSKITELEIEVSEHSLVLAAIKPLDQSRRCYRMIGGVLVERTIKEVLPAVDLNKQGLEEVINRLNEALERKKKEISEFELKYKIKMKRGGEALSKEEEAAAQKGISKGVLVDPAGEQQT